LNVIVKCGGEKKKRGTEENRCPITSSANTGSEKSRKNGGVGKPICSKRRKGASRAFFAEVIEGTSYPYHTQKNAHSPHIHTHSKQKGKEKTSIHTHLTLCPKGVPPFSTGEKSLRLTKGGGREDTTSSQVWKTKWRFAISMRGATSALSIQRRGQEGSFSDYRPPCICQRRLCTFFSPGRPTPLS